MIAVKMGCINVIKLMLSHPRIDVNFQIPRMERGDTKTALHSAAEDGHVAIVHLFLQNQQVDVNLPSDCPLFGDGMTIEF